MNLFEALEVYAASIEARDFSRKKRKALAKTGAAMPGGRYPIENTEDLGNAEHAIGRTPPSGRAAVKRHIRQRAKALHVKLSSKWQASGKKKLKADSITNPSSFRQPSDMGPSSAMNPE